MSSDNHTSQVIHHLQASADTAIKDAADWGTKLLRDSEGAVRKELGAVATQLEGLIEQSREIVKKHPVLLLLAVAALGAAAGKTISARQASGGTS